MPLLLQLTLLPLLLLVRGSGKAKPTFITDLWVGTLPVYKAEDLPMRYRITEFDDLAFHPAASASANSERHLCPPGTRSYKVAANRSDSDTFRQPLSPIEIC
jgi:hypothetical protein